MIRGTFIRFASAIALLGATACDDDASGPSGGSKRDAAVQDAGGDPVDANVGLDGSTGVDGGEDPDGGSDPDAGADAATDPMDATTDPMDAGTDASSDTDAGQDAQTDEPDAQSELDAGTDAGEDDAGPDGSTGVVLPALAAWYTFDENTGTEAADSAGGFGNAVLHNDAAWVPGVHGTAVQFTGGASNQEHPYVSLPANILDGCNDVTLAFWMKLTTVTPWARILEVDGKVDGFVLFSPAQMIDGQPHLWFNIWDHPAALNHGVSAPYPNGTTLEDTWHHVAFTLSAGIGRLYFDGVEIGSGAMDKKPADLTLGDGAHALLGRTTTHQDPYLNGAIDDLRVSCTAYSADQIAAIAEKP